MSSRYQQISLDVADGVATVTLDRPDKLNAFTARMMHELIDAFDRTDADDAVRAVIVTGRGRAFCAGADMSSGTETFVAPGDGVEGAGGSGGSAAGESAAGESAVGVGVRDGGGQVVLRIFDSLKPVIAAINGPAVGVGITMTLPMDVRLAADTARIGFVFSRRGLVPEACSSWFLPRVVGISQAAEWVYTGRVFDASEARAAGLVRSVHSADELLGAAQSLAREMADTTSPVSVALSRQMLWRMLGAAHPMLAHRVDSRGIRSRGASDDAREGITSFFEKRPPRFPLRVSADLPDIFPGWDPPGFA